MRKKGDAFYVRLSLKEVVRYITKGVLNEGTSNEIVSEYGDLYGDQGFYMIVFEKYYMRAGNRASLTVLMHKVDNKVKIFSVGSGGGQGTIFSFDWGASDKFESLPRRILENYIV